MFVKQQLHVNAGYLSYVTLMSLVPLIVVMLSVMTAFPIFTDIKELIENFVYKNFVPASGDVVQEHISGFVENASKMSAVAISFLFLFALLLISAIDKSLNKLWQVTEKRRVITAFFYVLDGIDLRASARWQQYCCDFLYRIFGFAG